MIIMKIYVLIHQRNNFSILENYQIIDSIMQYKTYKNILYVGKLIVVLNYLLNKYFEYQLTGFGYYHIIIVLVLINSFCATLIILKQKSI